MIDHLPIQLVPAASSKPSSGRSGVVLPSSKPFRSQRDGLHFAPCKLPKAPLHGSPGFFSELTPGLFSPARLRLIEQNA
jgi:hypothetical protein